MELLFITRPIVPPWNEGSKNLVWHMAQRLQRHRAHLVTVKDIELPKTQVTIDWEPVYTASELSSQQKIRLLLYLIGKRGIDLYHSFFVPTPVTSYYLGGLSHIKGIRTIQTVPSLYGTDLSRDVAQRIFFADQIIAISDDTANRLDGFGLKNVTRINVGIDVGFFADYPTDSLVRQQYNLPPGDVIILFSGEYSRTGSIERLLAVMPEVIARCANCHFVFACRIVRPTDPAVKDALQKTIHRMNLDHKVHFLGEVDDFPALLKASDLFLFPTSDMVGKFDTPLTLLEAMAAGLPVIINDLPPLNEAFMLGAGACVPLGDDAAMIEAIISLANSAEQRRKAGHIAYETVKARYNIDTMVQAYERLYDSFA